jgi:hypothetical protein
VEDDPANPLSVYGRTKFEGEERIRGQHAKHLIFRTSWVYTARGKNFIKTILRLAKEKERLEIIADQYGAPTSAELIADITALALYRVGHMESSTAVAGRNCSLKTGCLETGKPRDFPGAWRIYCLSRTSRSDAASASDSSCGDYQRRLSGYAG